MYDLAFAARVKQLRWNRLRLSRTEFQRRFGVPARTLQDVEQGRSGFTRSLAALILAIEAAPNVVARAVADNPQLFQAPG